MKLSTLLEILQHKLEELGDVPVLRTDEDYEIYGDYYEFEESEILVIDTNKIIGDINSVVTSDKVISI